MLEMWKHTDGLDGEVVSPVIVKERGVNWAGNDLEDGKREHERERLSVQMTIEPRKGHQLL